MKRMVKEVLKFSYFFLAMFLLFSNSAHAYIDPSATTYVIQAVGAVLIALGAMITVFRHKITAFFKKDKSDAQKKEIHFEDSEEKNE